MSIPHHCDVVVIGGGPGGSLTATYLSQMGYTVVLLERQKHPRPHVGESLLPHFWKYCDAAGVSAKIEAEGFVRKAGGTVIWQDTIRQMAFKDFGFTRPSLHVERDRFDQILIDHAREQGAQIFEEVEVRSVTLQDDPVAGQQQVYYRELNSRSEGQITCRFVVDASGQNAVLARQLGIREIDEGFRFASIWGYFTDSKYFSNDGCAYPFAALNKIPATTFVTWIPDSGDWGWVWHIPLRTETSVGLILPIEQLRAAKEQGKSWETYFLQKCAEIPYLRDLLKDATYRAGSLTGVQDYSYRSTQLTGPGFFLVGDAAGFIDPIFSAGILISMYSAYTSAWAINRCFKQPQQTFRYQSLYTQQLTGRLAMARSLALPGYRTGDHTNELAKTMVQFESGVEQELMAAAAKLTTRAENFADLIKDEQIDRTRFETQRYRVLERLVV